LNDVQKSPIIPLDPYAYDWASSGEMNFKEFALMCCHDTDPREGIRKAFYALGNSLDLPDFQEIFSLGVVGDPLFSKVYRS
jgi:hypothetical protein